MIPLAMKPFLPYGELLRNGHQGLPRGPGYLLWPIPEDWGGGLAVPTTTLGLSPRGSSPRSVSGSMSAQPAELHELVLLLSALGE